MSSATKDWMVDGSVLKNYLQSCKDCDINNFKKNPHLTAIWEHCSSEVAKEYLMQVTKDNSWLLNHKFTNDFKGNPIMIEFVHNDILLYEASASTMQYIGVLSNLIKYFGKLNDLRILEIGGGYGGQARTILDIFKPKCYHIIDLPEVNGLIKRYIDEVEVFEEPTGQHYDLLISNYALSEIRDNAKYMSQCVFKSKRGYITCNTDMVKIPFPHTRIPDVKGERETNYILLW